MRFSERGMEPDPKKVEALKHAEPPSTVTDLKSFLGMANYSSYFISIYSQKTAILRDLLKDNEKWEWADTHQKYFDELKEELQRDRVFQVKYRNKSYSRCFSNRFGCDVTAKTTKWYR